MHGADCLLAHHRISEGHFHHATKGVVSKRIIVHVTARSRRILVSHVDNRRGYHQVVDTAINVVQI